jgi:hypothetical protein
MKIDKKNDFQVQGIIHSISDEKEAQTGTYRWKEVVIETFGSKYTDYLLFQANNEDIMHSLSKYQSGELVNIRFKISGRLVEKEGEERVYNNNQIININKLIR